MITGVSYATPASVAWLAERWHVTLQREFWADTLLCQNQMFLENPDWLLVWYYHFFLILNTHLEYLVVKDSRQLVDDSKQAVQLRIRLICCWTPYCPGCQEKTVLVSSHGEGDCCNERNTLFWEQMTVFYHYLWEEIAGWNQMFK